MRLEYCNNCGMVRYVKVPHAFSDPETCRICGDDLFLPVELDAA